MAHVRTEESGYTIHLKFLIIRCLLGISVWDTRPIITEGCWPAKYSLKHGQNAIYYKVIIISVVVNISGLQYAFVHIY